MRPRDTESPTDELRVNICTPFSRPTFALKISSIPRAPTLILTHRRHHVRGSPKSPVNLPKPDHPTGCPRICRTVSGGQDIDEAPLPPRPAIPASRPNSQGPMNRNEYDSGSYSGSRQPPSPYTYPASGYEPMPRPPPDFWERRSRLDGYQRRGSDLSRLRSQYTRHESPYRDPRDYKMESPRREYSPLRKVSKGLDGVFKGFTTALPGNDPGYLAELEPGASVRTPSSRRYSEVDRASLYRGLSNAGSVSGSVPAAGNDLYASGYRYPADRADYSANRANYGNRTDYSANPSYLEDYPPEPSSQYLPEAGKRYEPAYTPSVGSRRSADYRWDARAATPPPSTPCWDVEPQPASPRMGEQPLSPRTFKRECQRAFKEARAQRMRNLEEGLYGKCDWATFDAKYC